ncbi:protoheme IX farnesyltransferase [Kaustia mangrovi]|uniref:Protoheme IX farnesyltransferase n=1 Tax=Kaustia mangrovi TaxID=2593653 RepID=A0A7S8HB48_9HYPH|nr:heme o synthase [Kaustia mangrovi]QPC42136.1 protoheme IX farnesyltransferase [Kaustia mangrovi]
MSDVSAELSVRPLSRDGDGSAQPGPAVAGADVADYFALLKPRVMSLVLFTALVGLVVAPGTIHPWLAMVALLCIAVGAGASGALNMWFDADIDAVMQRTASRPIPRGEIAPGEALGFGLTLSVGAVAAMGVLVNWTAAGLLAGTIAFYVLVYTIWLKRRTPQNIVIGGAAGAFPPMVGWAAVTGTVDLDSLALFAIIFMWTPPHFWALALYRSEDYRRAGVPMMPVVAGGDETRRQILIYSVLLVATTMLPYVLGFAGVAYLAVAIALGALFIVAAWRVYRIRTGRQADRAAKQMFGYSVLYLFMLFVMLLAEHSLSWTGIAL